MADIQLQKIFTQLEDHEKRIRVIENNRGKNLGIEKLKIKKKTNAKNKGEDLFPPIQKLLEGGLFKDWQTDLNVCNALTIKLLTKKKPLRTSVVNVLRVFVKKELLTRDKIQKNKRQVFAYKQV